MDFFLNFFHFNRVDSLDAVEFRKRDLFIRICVLCMVTLFFYALVNAFNSRVNSMCINCLSFIFYLSTLFYYKHSGNYQRSVLLFISISLFGIGIEHFFSASQSRGHLIWYPLIIMVACFMLKKDTFFKVSLVILIAGLGIEYLSSTHSFTLDEIVNEKTLSINIAACVTSSLIAYLVGMNIKKTEFLALSRLDASKQKLADLSESNAMLVSILSHDLANHIHSIHSYSKVLLKRGQLNDIDRNKLEKVFNTTNNMKHLIEEVRQLKASEDGKLNVSLKSVNLLESLYESINCCRPIAMSKNVHLKLMDADEGLHIKAEQVSLVNSVFNNVISNAIKFSHKGSSIDISVREDENEVNVCIRDYGVGMKDEFIKDLFDANKPTSHVGTGGERGTGFGLPIVRMYMDRYDGKIDIKSSTRGENSGTLFTLTFEKMSCGIKIPG